MSEALLVDDLPGPLERDGVLVAHGGEPVDRLADLVRIGGAEATQDPRVRMLNQISTWLSHEAWVGV